MDTRTCLAGLWVAAFLAAASVDSSQAQPGELGGKRYALAAAPAIVVSPEAISDSLLINEVRTTPLKIYNPGEEEIAWQVDIARSFDGRLDGVRIVWDRAHGQPPASTYSVMLAELAARGAVVSENFDNITSAVLSQADIWWTGDLSTAWSGSEIAALDEWLWSGGGLLLEIENPVSAASANALFSAAQVTLYYRSFNMGSGWATDIVPHPATYGVDSLYIIGSEAYLSSIPYPPGPLVRFNGFPAAAQGLPGSGMGAVFAVTDEMFYNPGPGGPGADNIAFGHRVIDWLVNNIKWAKADPVSGVVAPADSAEVLVTLDPRLLFQGVFHAELRVTSDDPVAPETIVPIRLAVKGIPSLGLSPLSLAYGTLRPSESVTKNFQVANRGSGELIVDSITSSDPHFAPDPVSFVLWPEESLLVDVTFVSAAEGAFSGLLTVSNNDPNAGPGYIQVSALVADSAQVILYPDSIVDTLWAGESVTRDLKIENAGGRALHWRIGVSGVSGARILYDRSKSQGSPSVYGALLSDLAAAGATVTEFTGYITPEILATGDVYWTTEMYRSWSSTERSYLKNWTSQGGGILLEGDETTSISNFNSLLSDLNAGIAYSYGVGAVGVTANIFPHEVTIGVDRVFLPGPRARLTLTNPGPAQLVADASGAMIVAASTYGVGRIVAFSDEFLADPYYLQEDNRTFGDGAFGWLARTVSWVSVSADTGTVPSHAESHVAVTLDAEELVGGVYRGRILVESNDPQDPLVSLPVRLHVLDFPTIVASPDTLDFGVVVVDSTMERTLVVRNAGRAALAVTSIVSDAPQFSPDPESLEVAPGESEEVIVSFSPTGVGPAAGTLSIASNDPFHPVRTVSVEGGGFQIPDVTVVPGELADTLTSGASSEKTLTVHNAGPGPFEWYASFIRDIAVAAPNTGAAGGDGTDRAGADLGGVDVLFDRSRGQETSVNWSVIVSDLAARGAVVTENTVPITPELLAGYDVYWGIDMKTTWTSAEKSALAGWVLNGGGLLLMADQEPTLGAFNSLLIALGVGISFIDGGSAAGVTSSIDTHETTFGVDSLTMSAPHARLLSISAPAVRLFRASNGAAMGAAAVQGKGRIVAIAEELFGNDVIQSTDNRRFGNQVVDYLSPVVGWLTASPMAGSVAEGDSAHVVVRFDAAGRCAGDYEATVRLTCAPVHVVVAEVPARLHTTDAPRVAVSPAPVVFDGVFVGNSARKYLAVRNDGCAELSVLGFDVDGGSYSVESAPFDLAPGESRPVEVEFHPASVGLIEGLLVILSSDPLQGELFVALSGEGVDPPGIAVSPDSLAERLLPGGASLRTLSVTNTGSAPLEFAIDCIGRPDPSAAVATGCVAPAGTPAVTRPLEPYETGGPPAAGFAESMRLRGAEEDLPFEGSPVFTEDFEDGDFDGWTRATGPGVREVTDVTAANGTVYSYHDIAADYGHFTGIHRDLGAPRIRTVRFSVRTGSAATNGAYFVVRDATGLEAIFFFATQIGTFYVNANVGGNQSHPYEAGRWYEVEFSDIDWETKTFDYLVDGTLVQSGVPFRNASQVEEFSRVDLYNYTKNAEAWWDELWISTGYPIDWLRSTTREGLVASDSLGAVGLIFDAGGLSPGAYEGLVVFRTNVPSARVLTVPARLDVDPSFARTLVIPLDAGWNSISWNVETDSDSASVLFAGVLDRLAVAHGFDGGGLTYDPGVPPEFRTLSIIDHRRGCRLKMTEPDTLYVTGWALDAQTPAVVEPGYNLIGYAPNEIDSVAHALASVIENTALVLGYDGTTLVFDPAVDPSENTLHVLEPGGGYWLKMTEEDSLIYPRLPVVPFGLVLAGASAGGENGSPAVTPTPEWISLWGSGMIPGGTIVPAGAVVRAIDPDGVACGEWTVTSPGKIGLMPVYRDDPFTPEDEGAEPGDSIRVDIDNVPLTNAVVWEANGAVVDLKELYTGIETASFVTRLFQNHPNPFNPTTTIRYSIASPGRVTLKIYNAAGQLVRTLVDEDQVPAPGGFSKAWDGMNSRGQPVASGVYFYRLTAGEFTQTKKMVLLK